MRSLIEWDEADDYEPPHCSACGSTDLEFEDSSYDDLFGRVYQGDTTCLECGESWGFGPTTVRPGRPNLGRRWR